jgi:hypothetical protein
MKVISLRHTQTSRHVSLPYASQVLSSSSLNLVSIIESAMNPQYFEAASHSYNVVFGRQVFVAA